jgi:hypothetical protein
MRDLDSSNSHLHKFLDNVVNIQIFGNGFFYHHIDHPIISNRHRQ